MEIKKQHLTVGSNKRSGRKIRPRFITVHSTGNPNSTAQNERDWLSNPSNKSVTGWHYVVGEDIIIEAIPPTERAWHAGDGATGTGNNQSIGIEMVETGNRKKVIENTIWLIKTLQHEFDISDDRVVRHHDWSGKNCPRILNYNNWQGWYDFKTLLRGSDKMTDERVIELLREELNKKDLPVSEWAKKEWTTAKEKGITDGSNPQGYATREEVVALILRALES